MAISYMLAKSFAHKVDSNSREWTSSYAKKIKEPPDIEMHQMLLWTVSSFFFGDKFVKHFSLEFQQLNRFCQVFGAEH